MEVGRISEISAVQKNSAPYHHTKKNHNYHRRYKIIYMRIYAPEKWFLTVSASLLWLQYGCNTWPGYIPAVCAVEPLTQAEGPPVCGWLLTTLIKSLIVTGKQASNLLLTHPAWLPLDTDKKINIAANLLICCSMFGFLSSVSLRLQNVFCTPT